MSKELFSSLKEIRIEKPVDKIVDQINELISSGQLKTGDKLPSERFLSEKYKVGRMFVRDAIRKLEFYGMLKTVPKSGTLVTGNHDSAFAGLVVNALGLIKPDYKSLLEVRFLLEIESAGLAAEKANAEDIELLEEKLYLFGSKVAKDKSGLMEDLMFHIQLAETSKNSVIKHLISFLLSHMTNFTTEYDICRDSRYLKAYNEHVVILEHIKNSDVEKAKESMRNHLSSLIDFIPESNID